MSTTIDIPIDQPDASFGSIGNRYFGIYRLPYGRWRQLLGPDKQRLYFATPQEATRAAMAAANRILFGKIGAHREPDEKHVADALGVEAWKAERAQKSIESRKVFRGAGKKPFIEERRRQR